MMPNELSSLLLLLNASSVPILLVLSSSDLLKAEKLLRVHIAQLLHVFPADKLPILGTAVPKILQTYLSRN